MGIAFIMVPICMKKCTLFFTVYNYGYLGV